MQRHWQRNSDKKKLVRTVWLVGTVLLVGLLLPRAISLVGMVVLYPVQNTQQWFAQTTSLLPALWRDKTELQQQAIDLEAQLAQISLGSLSEQRLREENVRLRSLLGATTSQRIAATVIGRPDELPFDVLQIDQGSAVVIEVGAPVYANNEDVLGVVSAVYPRSALVTLFTTAGLTTTAYLGEADRLVRVEGLGGGSARVLVPQGIPLRVNSLVYIPSIQPGVLGRIVAVENEPTQPQQFGYIVSTVPMGQLRYVSVGQVADVRVAEVDVQAYVLSIQEQLQLPDILLATSTATTTDDISTSTVDVELESQI